MVIPICMINPTKNVALYTVITGNYDKPRTNPRTLNIPCILITDSEKMGLEATKNGWQVHNLPNIPDQAFEMAAFNNTTKNQWTQRYLKIHPHVIPALHNFEFVIWADGNLEVSSKDVENCISNKGVDVLRKKHPNPRRKNKVSNELAEIGRKQKNKSYGSFCSSFKEMQNEMKLAGFADQQLTETNFLGRRKPCGEEMIRLAEDWWRILQMNNCWRDQAGFDYALWRSKLAFDTVTWSGKRHWHRHQHRKGLMPDK